MLQHETPAPEWLSRKYLEEILRKDMKEPELRVLQIGIEPGSSVGDNFLGQIFRIKLVLDINGQNQDLSVIGKLTPESTVSASAKEEENIFHTESTAFTLLLPLLIEENRNIDSSKTFSPHCYHVDYDRKFILMEDLMVKNFKMLSKSEKLTLDQTVATVEALACWHGASYRVLQKNPNLKLSFLFTFWTRNPADVMIKWFKNCHIALDRNVNDYGISEELCRKVRGLEEKLKKDFMKVCEPKEGGFNILVHGDPWINNVLYHFTDGVVDDVVLLDYQMIHYGSFAHDLHYHLFSSVKASIIVEDLDTILEKYYTKLKAVAPEIPNLTLERVKDEFSEKLFFGLILTLVFRPCFAASDPPDMERVYAGEVYEAGFQDEQYKSDAKLLLPFFEKIGVL